MPVETQTILPFRIVAGNTLILQLGFIDFSAALWHGDLVLSRAGTALKVSRAAASGANFLWTLAPADTSSIAPGQASAVFQFTEIATSQVASLPGAPIRIEPNPGGILPESAKQAALRIARAALTTATAAAKMSGFEKVQTVQHELHRLREEVTKCEIEVNAELRSFGIAAGQGIQTLSIL